MLRRRSAHAFGAQCQRRFVQCLTALAHGKQIVASPAKGGDGIEQTGELVLEVREGGGGSGEKGGGGGGVEEKRRRRMVRGMGGGGGGRGGEQQGQHGLGEEQMIGMVQIGVIR